MEKGDPRVGIGVYAMALWLIGQDKALRDLASFENDAKALSHASSVIPHDNLRAMRHAEQKEPSLFASESSTSICAGGAGCR